MTSFDNNIERGFSIYPSRPFAGKSLFRIGQGPREGIFIFNHKTKNLKDYTGQRKNKLVAVRFVTRSKNKSWWEFLCDCGNSKILSISAVFTGSTGSCGCFKKKTNAVKRHPLYQTWRKMLDRCYRKNDNYYHAYGARGIYVCDRWKKFWNFVEDIGVRPDGKTMDRIDNNGPYCKENFRWATPREQSQNTRRNVFLTFQGITKCLTEWSREFGCSISKVKIMANQTHLRRKTPSFDDNGTPNESNFRYF
jgi:hypothetical protein